MADEITIHDAPDIPHAPFVFYDGIAVSGTSEGIIDVSLFANRSWTKDGGVVVRDRVVVAYLRSNLRAATALRDAIDAALHASM